MKKKKSTTKDSWNKKNKQAIKKLENYKEEEASFMRGEKDKNKRHILKNI